MPTLSYCQNLDSIKTQLEGFYWKSLKQRSKVSFFLNKYGPSSKQFDSLNQAILFSDSLTLESVTRIVDKYGWLGIDQIGDTGNQTLFLSIQHSDLKTMERYYPLLKLSVKNHKSREMDLALLEDRILILRGLPQKYGTQYKYDTLEKSLVYFPIDDIKHINRRRHKVGLDSFKKFSSENKIALPKEK